MGAVIKAGRSSVLKAEVKYLNQLIIFSDEPDIYQDIQHPANQCQYTMKRVYMGFPA